MLDLLQPLSATDGPNSGVTAAKPLRPAIAAQMTLPNIDIAVRNYEWDAPEAVIAGRPVYQIFQLLTPMRQKRRIRWRLANERYPRSVAQLSIVPPHSPILIESESGQASFISCTFDPEYFEGAVGIDQWTSELTASFLSLHNRFIEAIMDRLVQEITVPHDNSAVLLEALMSSLLFELARIVGQSRKPLRSGKLAHWRLARVRALVEDSLGGATIAVAELAARCSISPRHLMRGFKAATGTTIHAYVAQIRIERAKALLEASSMPLRDIAEQVGFSNASHFAAEFRRRIGCSPSEHRVRARTG